MEGLVNYSSEEEQDESSYKRVAERGSPLPLKKRTSSVFGGSRSMRGPLSPPPMRLGTSGLGGGGGVGVAGGSGRGSCKEENASARHRGDHRQDSRSSMHHRERIAKEAKDTRNYGNGHGNSRELKLNERQRSKDYRSESYRSNSRRTPRNDHNDRNRQSSSTTQHQHHNQRHRDRYSVDKPRHGDDKSSSHRHQRLRDERSERPERTERNERPERSTRKERPERKSPSHHRHRGDTRSPTPPPPPTPPPQHYQQHQQYTKRSSHYDKRSRTPSRSRSRTPTTPKVASCEHVLAPLEKARLSALEMERKLNSCTSAQTPSEVNVTSIELPSLISPLSLPSLPLNDNVPKQPNVIISMPINIGGIAAANATPTIIQLPSYYNPSVINPNKYAEQMQKRKLLWGAKKSENTAAKWGHAQFSQDSDGKVASKFMRLMGIKGDVAAAVVAKSGGGAEAADGLDKNFVGVAPDVKSREAMFSTMEHQYEVARQVTHTMRGVGLGFGSQSRPF